MFKNLTKIRTFKINYEFYFIGALNLYIYIYILFYPISIYKKEIIIDIFSVLNNFFKIKIIIL